MGGTGSFAGSTGNITGNFDGATLTADLLNQISNFSLDQLVYRL